MIKRQWIALLTLALVAATLFLPLPLAAAASQHHTLTVDARAFAYEPAVLDVHRGDTVTLRLQALDSVHGLAIDGYGVDLKAEPGRSAQTTFVADREGTYKFRCSVTCGALHPFMIGELKVEPGLPFVRALIALGIATVGAVAFFWKSL